jgi:hypothetical protein
MNEDQNITKKREISNPNQKHDKFFNRQGRMKYEIQDAKAI